MKIKYGDMLDTEADHLVVTTNGFVTKTGNAVMGRGIALKIANLVPGIKAQLGKLLNEEGNVVHELIPNNKRMGLISFPVKPIKVKVNKARDNVVSHARDNYKVNQVAPGFHAIADIKIIAKSCRQLVKLADEMGMDNIILPFAGCGAGELDWEKDVRPIMESLLDDRFTAMTFESNKPVQSDVLMVCGSLSIHHVVEDVLVTLKRAISGNVPVIVGDANGADSVVQSFLSNMGYKKVTVYYMGKAPRNKMDKAWKQVNCNNKVGDKELSPRKWYTVKDKEMCKVATHALHLWDGKSKGTKRNQKHITKLGGENLVIDYSKIA